MSKQLLIYKGVYGEQQQPFWDSAVYIEPIVQTSSVYNFEINEHLHTELVQIFILEKGGGKLFSEGKEIPIETPCIIIIPNGVLHGFLWEPNIRGKVMTIALPFYEKCLEDHLIVLNQFQQLQHLTFDKKENTVQEFIFINQNLESELAERKVEKQQVIQLLIQLLMTKLYQRSITGQNQIISNDNKTLAYFNAFQREIANTIDSTKKIQEYARKLNITSVHLNRICQSLVQKSALQIVHEKMITEAKKYLLYTNKTIAEVAYSLNFKDPSHFSKFFKKLVGVGPRKFRQSQDGYIST